MIRTLFLIAIGGFVLSLASFSAAIAIGGPEAVTRGIINGHPWTWDWDSDDDGWDRDRGRWAEASGPTITREVAWSGRETVQFDIPADITFTQAPGPAKLTVTGPKGAVDRVVVEGEHVRFDRRVRPNARLTVVMTAPNVTGFGINGSDRLTINDYRQDRLDLDLSGSAEVTARGQARELDVDISGSGEAHLGGLTAQGASVDISGSGEATVAPSEWADLDISGSGEINLLTNPRRLESDVSGSGSIHQGQSAEQPSPAPVKDGAI